MTEQQWKDEVFAAWLANDHKRTAELRAMVPDPNAGAERYDYKNQAWTKNWIYMSCNHPDSMDCGCYGRLHAGELASEFKARTLAERPWNTTETDNF